MKGKKSLLGWSGFIFAMRLSGAVTVLLTQILLARWMGAYELGVYVLAFSWLIMLSTSVGLGFPMASMRILGKAQHDGEAGIVRGYIRRGREINFGVGVLASLVGIAVVMLKAPQLSISQQGAFILAFLCIPVLATMRMHERAAQAHGWFVLAMLPNMFLRPIFFLLLVWAAALYGMALDARQVMLLHVLLIGFMALVHALVFSARMRRQLGAPKPAFRDREWFHVALPLLIVTLFSQYFADLDITVVGLILPPEQLAQYNAGYRIALVISFGFLAVNAVLMPRVSRLYAAGDTAAIQSTVALATLATVIGAAIAITLLVILGEKILLLFGEEFVPAYQSMLILATSQLLLAVIGPVATLLSVTGHQLYCLKVFSWSLLGLVVFSIVLTPMYGMNGAAFAVLLVTLFWALMLRGYVRKYLNVESSILSSWVLLPRK